jgi:hypothetical protein
MTREDRYSAAEKLKDDGDLAGAVAALETLVAEEPEFALAHSALGAWCMKRRFGMPVEPVNSSPKIPLVTQPCRSPACGLV